MDGTANDVEMDGEKLRGTSRFGGANGEENREGQDDSIGETVSLRLQHRMNGRWVRMALMAVVGLGCGILLWTTAFSQLGPGRTGGTTGGAMSDGVMPGVGEGNPGTGRPGVGMGTPTSGATIFQIQPSPANTDMIVVSTPLSSPETGEIYQQLIMIDTKKKVICVYHVDAALGQVALQCVRPFEFDQQLQQYYDERSKGHTVMPSEIRHMLQDRQP